MQMDSLDQGYTAFPSQQQHHPPMVARSTKMPYTLMAQRQRGMMMGAQSLAHRYQLASPGIPLGYQAQNHALMKPGAPMTLIPAGGASSMIGAPRKSSYSGVVLPRPCPIPPKIHQNPKAHLNKPAAKRQAIAESANPRGVTKPSTKSSAMRASSNSESIKPGHTPIGTRLG